MARTRSYYVFSCNCDLHFSKRPRRNFPSACLPTTKFRQCRFGKREKGQFEKITLLKMHVQITTLRRNLICVEPGKNALYVLLHACSPSPVFMQMEIFFLPSFFPALPARPHRRLTQGQLEPITLAVLALPNHHHHRRPSSKLLPWIIKGVTFFLSLSTFGLHPTIWRAE
jgi:hypothetical protein